MPRAHSNTLQGAASPHRDLSGRLVVCAALVVLVAVGGWLRLRHLGKLGFIGDEGIQALAVQGILNEGVPRVDSGRLYARALPFLYVQAAAARRWGLDEFSLRLPSAVCGTMVILLAYLLGATVADRRVGLVLAGLLAFSVWEIELSRYARSYTALQCAYLAALLLFYHGYLLGRLSAKIGFFVAAFVALSLHQLGILLATCFLIPIVSERIPARRKGWYLFGILGVVALWGIAYGLEASGVAAAAAVPDQGPRGAGGLEFLARRFTQRLVLPPTQAAQLLLTSPVFATLTILAMGVSWLTLRHGFRHGDLGQRLIRIGMLWAAWAHQFGLVLVLLALSGVLGKQQPRKPAGSVEDWVYAAVMVFGLFWTFWAIRFGGLEAAELGSFLFNFPHFRQYFLTPLLSGWPITAGLLAVGTAWFLRRFWMDRTDWAPLFILGALWIPLVVTSGVYAPSYNPRYWFHLYPILLLIIAALTVHLGWRVWHQQSGTRTAGIVITVAVAAAALGFGDDFRLAKGWAVGNRTYRNVRDSVRNPVNWKLHASFHQDHKRVGVYVREHRQPGERVMVLGPMHHAAMYHYYTNDVEYSLVEPSKLQRGLRAKRKVRLRRHPITGSEIVQDIARLKELVGETNRSGLWLIGDRQLLAQRVRWYSDPIKEYLAPLAARPDVVGEDGHSFAVRVPARAGAP